MPSRLSECSTTLQARTSTRHIAGRSKWISHDIAQLRRPATGGSRLRRLAARSQQQPGDDREKPSGRSGPPNSSGNQGSELPKPRLQTELTLLLGLLTNYPATRGTIAVLAAYYLKIDPFGNFHWNGHDAVLGLQCALPILALDALIMLPNYSPKSTKKEVRVKVPRSIAARIAHTGDIVDAGVGSDSAALTAPAEPSSRDGADGGGPAVAGPVTGPAAPAGTVSSQATTLADPLAAPASVGAGGGSTEGGVTDESELVEVERTITVRAQQHPLLTALHRAQLEKVLYNVSRLLSPPSELLLLLAVHLTEEMLAVLLTLVTGWTIDRLYEAGVDDVLTLGGLQLATPQAGALLATVACSVLSIALLVQRQLFPAKALTRQLERAAERRPAATPDQQRQQEKTSRAISRLKNGILQQRRWGVAIEGTRDVVEWTSLSTSFLLTGNLLSPFLSACVADLAFTLYQRIRVPRVEQARDTVSRQAKELMDIALLTRASLPSGERQRRRQGKDEGTSSSGGGKDAAKDGTNRSDSGADDAAGRKDRE